MKKILVTGGSGFIGSHMVDLLIKKNFVLNIDKLTYASVRKNFSHQNYKEINIDINNNQLSDIIKKYKPEYIINFAAESHVDNSIKNPKIFLKTNILGTFNILNSIIKNKLKIKFIHISTDEVFGSLKLNNSKFNLKSSYDPKSPYSASKASSDHLVRAYGNTFGLKFNIINCSNNFGERQHVEKLIPKTITNAFKNKKIPIYGNGKNIRDWIYVKDFCRAIYKVLIKSENKKTYLVGSNNELDNITIVKSICKILDKSFPKKETYLNLIEFVNDRPGHDLRYSVDNSSIIKLGWRPKYNFLRSLENTIKFYAKKK